MWNGTSYTWNFQDTGPNLKDLLYRVQFLDDGLTGWAVGQDTWYTRTTDGGVTWTHPYHVGPAGGQLWDVHFTDPMNGWLVEQHGLYRTSTGSGSPSDWTQPVLLLDKGGNPIQGGSLQKFDFYSLDIVPGPVVGSATGPYLGLMTAQPGLIFRTTDGVVWHVVFDIRDLCGTQLLPPCAQPICSTPPPATGFQPWDIEISRNPTQSLALMVGGFGNPCGMAFRSTDFGLTWTSEAHECTCTGAGCKNCATDLAYNDDGNPNNLTDVWRLKTFNTLYSVSIFDGDNSAIAGGYGGQHVKRNPATGVWEDRSQYSNLLADAPTAVTTPMYATAANEGGPTNKRGVMAGTGGFLQHSTDGGDTWQLEVQGDPWRIRDLCFIDNNTGWVVGQGYRVAKSIDGGASWNSPPVNPGPDIHGANFLSIAMDAGGQHGVAVGSPDNRPGATYQFRAKIWYANNSSGTSWFDPVSISEAAPGGSNGKDLREVEWAGGSTFWAAGAGGLIYSSQDNGQNWNPLIPPSETWSSLQNFDFKGLGFRDANTGIFVGTRNSQPKAYVFVGGLNPTWTSITPTDPSITDLTDVDIDLGGTVAYAVGVKTIAGVKQGVILVSTYSGGQFSTFVAVANHPVIPQCLVGDDLGSVPVLNRVEIAPSGIWVGGECGRVWQGTSGGTAWSEIKSQTDAHIRGFSFPSSGDGFAVAFRAGSSAYSIVRYH
ncbi:MAG: hypothetical protein IPJ19_19140 [Planctomycetes bacterium]|nr:hypothetical protein [Planctomycetota bacterium]